LTTSKRGQTNPTNNYRKKTEACACTAKTTLLNNDLKLNPRTKKSGKKKSAIDSFKHRGREVLLPW